MCLQEHARGDTCTSSIWPPQTTQQLALAGRACAATHAVWHHMVFREAHGAKQTKRCEGWGVAQSDVFAQVIMS